MSSQKSDLPSPNTALSTLPRTVTLKDDPYAPPAEYYGKSHAARKVAKSRTYSAHRAFFDELDIIRAPGHRRGSHDVKGNVSRQFILNVLDALRDLLALCDSDRNIQITIEDRGARAITVPTAGSGHRIEIRTVYRLSNLLQELYIATQYDLKTIVLDESRLNENPVDRLSRRINDMFWPNLTRRIDGSNVFQVAQDKKDWTKDPRPRIYVPRGAPEQYHYYKRVAEEHLEMRLDVQWLAEDPGDEKYVRELNEAPGLLAIEMERVADTPDGKPDYRGLPFVVPGGRFNELYGWDSYMETLGLLLNDRVDLCESMVRHFCFCIRHYGKILNANRTYYLCRSQPPLLTDMALRVYAHISHRPDALEFLRIAILAAIRDYYKTWMSAPRYDPVSGLSRYVPSGLGVPPETEASHFHHILTPYAEKHNMTFDEFVKAYNTDQVHEPELDEYFLHDRSVRESGHDTSYRLEKVSAHLATVDLNSLLYKYETDIALVIRSHFNDNLPIPPEWHVDGHPTAETSSAWDRRANRRRRTMDQLMWDESKGMFFDYHTVKQEQTGYESATTFWALWAGVALPRQAQLMVAQALPRFECHGGLVSGTEESRGPVGLTRPNRQWDYPYGWAPQQILAWTGLLRYGFEEEARRLAYRWVYMITKAFVDFNGVVVEKYDVTRPIDPHKVTAEYGNQGADFKGVATEGFGWVNASYVYGLQIVTSHMRRALGWVVPWDSFERAMNAATTEESAKMLKEARLHDGGVGKVHVAAHVHKAAEKVLPEAEGASSLQKEKHGGLPHSHEDITGHKATHGPAEKLDDHHGTMEKVDHHAAADKADHSHEAGKVPACILDIEK